MYKYFGVASAILFTAMSGCGKQAEPIEKASGVVTMEGQPVANAKVMFHPTGGASRISHATTDDKGEFKMSTMGTGDGALVGHHKVTISKIDDSSQPKIDTKALAKGGYGGAAYSQMMGPNAAKQPKPKDLVPASYASAESSGIEVDVVQGEKNHFTFELDSKSK